MTADASDEARRFAASVAAIDAANAEDPTLVSVRDRTGPKEVLHADLVTEWVRRLRPDAPETLLLAARGHHFRRWTVPRSSYPAGRSGYLRWRRDLHRRHAEELGAVLREHGYDRGTVARVGAIVAKEGLAHDPEVQTLEDALCLVFLETQLGDVAARLEPQTLQRVVRQTVRKMSDAGRAAIPAVPLDAAAAALLDTAIAPLLVERYLTGLATGDWDGVAATLAPDVVRRGPYDDDVSGRSAYVELLRTTITALSGYTLDVDRTLAAGSTVVVQLAETVDDRAGRRRTEEAVVFDVDHASISAVTVYLRGRRPDAAA